LSSGAYVHSIGLMTPVGDSTAQTVASVNAGINRYAESHVMTRKFRPMTLATVPEENLPPISPDLDRETGLTGRQIRMLRLAGPALAECGEALPGGAAAPLYLALPEPYPGRPDFPGDEFIDRLRILSGPRLAPPGGRAFTTGRGAFGEALAAALDGLGAGHGFAMVGGIDTYFDLGLLGVLDGEERVLAEGVMDGFAPGEGAAFLLLGTAPPPPESGRAVRVHRPGISVEPGHRLGDEPCLCDGLTSAVADALEAAGSPIVRTVLSSLNGESFGGKEWGVAQIRNAAAFAEDFRFEHPADCYGDPGAAAGPILLGLAAAAIRDGLLPDPALVWCASDGEDRAAAVVALDRNGGN